MNLLVEFRMVQLFVLYSYNISAPVPSVPVSENFHWSLGKGKKIRANVLSFSKSQIYTRIVLSSKSMAFCS